MSAAEAANAVSVEERTMTQQNLVRNLWAEVAANAVSVEERTMTNLVGFYPS